MSQSKVLVVERTFTQVVQAPKPPSKSNGMSLKLVLQLVRDNPSLLLYFYSHLLQTKPIKTKVVDRLSSYSLRARKNLSHLHLEKCESDCSLGHHSSHHQHRGQHHQSNRVRKEATRYVVSSVFIIE